MQIPFPFVLCACLAISSANPSRAFWGRNAAPVQFMSPLKLLHKMIIIASNNDFFFKGFI